MDVELEAKLKQNGQPYMRKDLTKMGWTKEMLSYLPEQRTRNSHKIYYRNADVRAVLEEHPEVREQVLTVIRAQAKKKAQQDAEVAEWLDLASKLAEALSDALANTDLSPDVRCIAEVWHKLFLGAVFTPRPLERWYGPIPSQCRSVVSGIRSSPSRMYSAYGLASHAVSTWRGPGHTAWVLMTQEDPSADIGVYIQTLVDLAEREIQFEFVKRGVTVPVVEIFASEEVRAHYPRNNSLYSAYEQYYLYEVVSLDLSGLISMNPKDEYPAARQMTRRFEIHVGGTNTGKTYQSLQRLKAAPTGVYLAPLRLLALEVQERLLDEGVICSMLTGEEEDIRENATHISSTVEKLDVHRHYDVAVIDECQMINDQERGFAWTRAILGVQAEEIHLCVAPEGLRILLQIIEGLGEPYTIVEHERKVPLRWIADRVPIEQAQKGDAFVAFSKRRVLQLADKLRQNGIPTSIIYGNLPYSTRRRQMQMFLDGETSVLVATDAIGMGLNLPIRRVIFAEDSKFDGNGVWPLQASEVQQIAGRAGRFGIYDEGFAAAGPNCDLDLSSRLEGAPYDVWPACLGFPETILQVDRPLADILSVWYRMPVKEPFRRIDVRRHLLIIDYIQKCLCLDFSNEDLLRAANIPFDETNDNLLDLFFSFCKSYAAGEPCVQKPELGGEMLGDLELYYKQLDLYYAFSKNFSLAWDKDWLTQEKESIAEEINDLLIHDLRSRGSSCRLCGAPIPLDSPYSLCDECHEKRRRELG